MEYRPIDASFEDSTDLSELEGAQLYDASLRRDRERREKKRAEERPQKIEKKEAVGKKRAPGNEVRREKAPADKVKPDRQVLRRDVVNASGEGAVVLKKRERQPITLRSIGRGIVSIMSTRTNVRVRTVSNKTKKPLPVSAFVMAIICTLLLMFMIVSYVQINEYTVAVSELRSELGDMIDRDKELSLELEKKNDMLVIEQKAGDLGMVKLDQLTKKHVSLTQDDKIEVVEPEPTYDSTVVTTIMSSIWQNFSGFWEYIG